MSYLRRIPLAAVKKVDGWGEGERSGQVQDLGWFLSRKPVSMWRELLPWLSPTKGSCFGQNGSH